MKALFYTFIFLIISFCVTAQDCKYYKNEVSEFDGTVTKVLQSQAIYKQDKLYNQIFYSIDVILSRINNKKYVRFDDNYNNGYIQKTIVKLKLDNGTIITFTNHDGSRANILRVEGILLPTEIKLLKASPINILRLEYPESLNDLGKFIDYKITGKSKYYFINNLYCINY